MWPSYLVVALACLSECIAVGFLLGRLGGPAWFAPVVTVTLLFLRLVTTLVASASAPRSYFTRLFLNGGAWVILSPIGVAIAALEAVNAIILALYLPSLIAHIRAGRSHTAYPWPRGRRRAAVVGSLGCVAAVVLVLASPQITEERPPPREPLCTATEFRICVWPDEAARLPALTSIAGRVPEQAQALGIPTPDHISSFGLERTRGLESGSGNFTIESDSTWFAASSAAKLLAISVIPARCTPRNDADQQEYFNALYELSLLIELRLQNMSWPQGMGDNSGIDRAEIARVWESDGAEQQAWIDQRVDTLRSLAAKSDPDHCS